MKYPMHGRLHRGPLGNPLRNALRNDPSTKFVFRVGTIGCWLWLVALSIALGVFVHAVWLWVTALLLVLAATVLARDPMA